ncbi:MAG TPA: HEAT repeat domain-containing protein [Vicinamibacteria bacterium]|nr:HEAT repeat domain-containing protein [Vicinamibacteria bacterium]
MTLARAAIGVILFTASADASGAGRASFEDLVANLKSPTVKTRLEAAQELGKSRRREAVTPLAAALRAEPEAKVRLEVVRALRELRNLDAVPALVAAMSDPEAEVREEALGSIVEVYSERERSGAVGRFLELFSDEYEKPTPPLFTTVDPSVFRALAQLLRDERKELRQGAAYAAGILDGRSIAGDLVAVLPDVEPGVRGAAATAIGKVGTSADGQKLIPLLSDESASVRNRALAAIGALRVREAGPALREMYEANRRKEQGVKVLESLSRVADPAQADLFREVVRESDPERKRIAVEGLARVSDASMLPAFKKDFQRERGDDLRLAYAFAIARLGDRDFLDTLVLGLPSSSAGKRVQGYLLELGPGILTDLYPYLNDQDAEIRAQLCDIIAAMGNASSLSVLEPLVNDPSPKVVDRANRAIERLRKPRS